MSSIKSEFKKNTCFILSSGRISFFIMGDKTIRIANIPLNDLENFLELESCYIRINRSIIINTQYFVNVFNSKERLILMKTGNILKVSRKNWINFK